MKVLLIEDEGDIREMLGHETILAADGMEGQEKIAEGGLDLVISDCDIPSLDEGLTVLKVVGPKIPKVLMSGRTENLAAKAASVGAIPLLKPFTFQEVRTLLEKVAKKPRRAEIAV